MSRTILYDLPHDVRGFVREDIDGEAIFILNARLTRESNMKLTCTNKNITKKIVARTFVLTK